MLITTVVNIPEDLIEKTKAKGMPYSFVQEKLSDFMREDFESYLLNEKKVIKQLEFEMRDKAPEK
jgi:hypothetical protein